MLMWGYTVLPTGQWFAVFLAVMMSIMVLFWVNETTIDVLSSESMFPFHGYVDSPSSPSGDEQSDTSLQASIVRLNSLKSELNAQYAQFGRDQSLINSKSLGSWHGTRNPRT